MKPKTHRIYDAYEEALGYKPNAPKKELAGAKKLKDYDIDDVIACYRHIKAQPFYHDKHLSLTRVAQDIAAWSQTRAKPMSDEEMEDWYAKHN